MNKLLISIFLVFTYIIIPVYAQKTNYYFKHFDIQNGLSQNTITSIFQDSRSFVWFGTKDGLNRYDGYNYKIYRKDPDNEQSIGNNTISTITEDHNGILWIGTDKGIYLYDPKLDCFSEFTTRTTDGQGIVENIVDIVYDKQGYCWIITGYRVLVYTFATEQLKVLDVKKETNINTVANAICLDVDGTCWIALDYFGIIKYDIKTDTYKPFYKNTSLHINKITDYKNNYLLLGTSHAGLLKINKKDQTTESIVLDQKNSDLFIREITMIEPHQFWIGTESGIYIYNDSDNSVEYLYQKPYDAFALSDNAVYSIKKDNEGGVWVGTFFGGINYFPKQYSSFEKFYHTFDKTAISGDRVREMCEDEQGNLWIATEDAGLNYLNTKTKTFRHFSANTSPVSISYHNIQTLHLHNNELWIGTFSKGIDVLDTKTFKTRHYDHTSTQGALDNDDIFALYTDNTGQTWIGTSSGVLMYDRNQDTFKRVDRIGIIFISDILEDNNGLLWFSTYNTGVIRYNPRTFEIKRYSYNSKKPNSLCFDRITSIFQDSKNRLWFCSEGGGFCLLNPANDTFTKFTTKDGLPNDVVHKIVEDNDHNFWVSTNNGLVCFDPETHEMKTFNQSNGLLSNQFNYKSGLKTRDGNLYFGCINGMVSFNPARFVQNDFIPQTVLTGFQLFNEEVKVGPDSPLKTAITQVRQIKLNYKQSSFSFDFAALSYTASEMNMYAYKLENFDSDWIYLKNKNRVTYSNIKPGKYTFRVKASNSDGKWSDQETTVDIVISPPFWKSIWAYIFYTLVTAAAVYVLINSNHKKQRKQNLQKQEKYEREKEIEVYNAKIDFFTNIAHEVRTPLTLIKSPLEYILYNDPEEKEIHENLLVMEKNTNRLLDLISQLLDFRKVESKVFSLNFKITDIGQLSNEVFIRFKALARQKNLKFSITLPSQPIMAAVDAEAMTKICSNLFNNAVKYSATYVDIQLGLLSGSGSFYIRVNNDGNPIPPELKNKIFEAFFQIDDISVSKKSGSGIGLTLANSLAQLHKGQLYLDTDVTGETSFVVEMPINLNASLDKENIDEVNTENRDIENFEANERNTILVVEDNEDLQHFLSDKLSKYYQVCRASNGEEALKIMDEKIVSLVITDIIMPVMDGLELCKTIKSDINYSHIPIVLLTARTNLTSKIEGLKQGADAYIEKPFSLNYLLAQITNLLDNRDKLRKTFTDSPFVHSKSIATTKADEQFLAKLTDVVIKNIEDDEFNVDNLAAEMNMSRSSLLRKIKGISELSPSDFIRLMKLKKAAELLKEGEYRVNEIRILVGFKSSSYFTKSFQKQFGVLPKDFAKKENPRGKGSTED